MDYWIDHSEVLYEKLKKECLRKRLVLTKSQFRSVALLQKGYSYLGIFIVAVAVQQERDQRRMENERKDEVYCCKMKLVSFLSLSIYQSNPLQFHHPCIMISFSSSKQELESFFFFFFWWCWWWSFVERESSEAKRQGFYWLWSWVCRGQAIGCSQIVGEG